MRFRFQPYCFMVTCSAIVIALLAGCLPGDALLSKGQPDDGLLDSGAQVFVDGGPDTETFIGGNAQRLVFMSESYPDLPPVSPQDPNTATQPASDPGAAVGIGPTVKLATVDPVSLEVTPLTGLTGMFSWETVSDGRWLAWHDYTDYPGQVRVLDLETGTQTQYFQDLGGNPTIVALENGRLILSATRGAETYVVVLDLASGKDSLLPTSIKDFNQLAARGDWLVMNYYPPLTSQPTSVEDLLGKATSQPADIDEVNLSSGQRATLAGVEPGTFYLTENQIIWADTPDGITTTVRAQDYASGQTRDLLTFNAYDVDAPMIENAGDPGLILYRSSYTPDVFVPREVYELYTPDGRTLPILDFAFTLDWPNPANPISIWPDMKFVGSLIIYRDPTSGDWAIYDTAAQSHRTVNPFAQ